MVLLFALPFLSGTGEKSPRRRLVTVLSVMMIVLIVGVLAYLGTYAPWSPQMDAWSGAPTPIEYVKGRTPLELQGALVLQNKQCRNCHSLGGEGGRRGPALDGVATRLTRDQLIRQVIQGGGNMPAYGKNLAPHEVTALVAFMQTLHQPYEAGWDRGWSGRCAGGWSACSPIQWWHGWLRDCHGCLACPSPV